MVLWGSDYLFAKIAMREISPLSFSPFEESELQERQTINDVAKIAAAETPIIILKRINILVPF